MLRRLVRGESGYSAVDAVTGLVLLALSIVSVYRVMIPSFALWRNSDERIARQQDVRLALDRMARDLRESTLTFNRLRVYNCSGPGANENCAAIGFVTARDTSCNGTFRLTGSADVNWQAVIYIWYDSASGELRRRCDTTTTLPVTTWPPVLTPYTVIGRQIVLMAFTLTPAGNPNPTAVAIAVREQAATASRPSHRYQTNFYNQTVFLPRN